MARILIIEDSYSIREYLKQLLQGKGHEVWTADNGKAGMLIHAKLPADLIITDIVMPDQDGLETIRNLKKCKKDTLIIAISGAGNDGGTNYLIIAKAFGAECTFQKPFNFNTLVSKVEKLLSRKAV